MKGRKGSIDEGGLRSPMFVRWPGRIRAGLTLSQIAGAIDLLPTLTELTGIDLERSKDKPLDGRSLAGQLLENDAERQARVLFAVKRNQVSVRTQRFRLDAQGQLFDIASDPGQRTDVADQHPDVKP